LALILGVTVDELLNADDKKQPTSETVEDKTVSEKNKIGGTVRRRR
jgi:hypothetical protein